MRASKIIRWTLYVLSGLVAGIILILVALAFVPIKIDLSDYKRAIESAATSALGREVAVEDKVIIATSLQPYFSLNRLRIANPKGFQTGDFLRMKKARIGVRVLPLLSGKIHVTEITVSGLSVLLVENEKGDVNWSFAAAGASAKQEPSKPTPSSQEKTLELQSDSLVVADLVLEDIAVDYRSPGLKQPLQFKIEECRGAMAPGKPFTLALKGMLLKEPYNTTIVIGSLKKLLEENRSRMEIKTDIAKTRFEFTGIVDLAQVNRSLKLKASVAGDRLDSLNDLLHLDLPPLKSYQAGAQLTLQKKQADLSDFFVQVGQSKLSGKMTVDNSGTVMKSNIELNSPLIQLNDFDVGDWSPEAGRLETPVPEKEQKKKSAPAAPKDAKASSEEDVASLLSPQVLAKYGVKMNVKVAKVLSGSDELGSGSLTATMEEGRFSVDPVKLNVPGGTLTLAASLKPDIKSPEASVRAVMENFDFGIIVRRAKPKADMGGLINLAVDLKSSAGSFDQLMANGNGYFDFSGRLENLESGIIDLWAVNLIAAVVSKDGKDASKINCVVGRWTMQDGLLKPDVFLIDTSKIRICGKGRVDFKKEHIDLQMAPTAKKAEYFSLATPIEVTGKFTDFGVGIQAGGLIGTAVNFAASPITTTFKRLVGKELPADGKDVCALPIGPGDRSAKLPAGCN